MNKVFSFLALYLPILILSSCPAGVYMPGIIPAGVRTIDSSTNAIQGMRCSLILNSSGQMIGIEYTDNSGLGEFVVTNDERITHQDENAFLANYTIRIEDVDGTNNLASFLTTNIIPKRVYLSDRYVIMETNTNE
jgi:hypothetical protein